jgi:fluoroquinolone resistance protein
VSKCDASQRIAKTLEKIKKSMDEKSKDKIILAADSNTEKPIPSTENEEVLTTPLAPMPIIDRKFTHLNWVKRKHQELTFKNCIISNSDFSNSNLDGLRLINCKIFNCNFEKASIQDGFFEDCIFYDKETQNGCCFNSADLKRTEFHRCNISMNRFKRVDAFQIVIHESQAQGCNFQFANFSNIISKTAFFSAADLTKTDFRYSDFEGVHLAKCNLSESKFLSVIFSKTTLDGADLTHTVFAPSQYDGLSIFKADLRNAEIANIDIRKLDFSGVKILEWQQEFFMENLGIIINPEGARNI